MTIHVSVLEQTEGLPHRLGRHVLHDDRSLQYDARMLLDKLHPEARYRPLKTVEHKCLVDPWDQGKIGDCTANAGFGLLMTEPFHRLHWHFTEPDCVKLYELETSLDDSQIPGRYPAQDTGSTGLWSMKALERLKLVTGYYHAFALRTVLNLLQQWPVSTGLPWYESMFDVDSDNVIQYSEGSGIAGGHQIALVGFDLDNQRIRVRNSWGTGWADGGYAWFKLGDYDALLHQDGDAVVPELAA